MAIFSASGLALFAAVQLLLLPGFATPQTEVIACSAATRPEDLTGYDVIFNSPDYPNSYPSDSDCQWRLTAASANEIVELHFEDAETEFCCDFVVIYDGSSEIAPIIGEFSGIHPAPTDLTYRSSGQYLYVKFTSNFDIEAAGFSATFTSKPIPTTTTTTTTTTRAPTTTVEMTTRDLPTLPPQGQYPCTPLSRPMNITADSGWFTSPLYPSNYPNDATCEWLITAADATETVTINFEYFSTEQCCDQLIIYNGDSDKTPVLIELAGQLAPPTMTFSSTQQYMFMRFVTDDVNTFPGFNATYTSNPGPGDPCSPSDQPADYTGLSGCFATANYPGKYDNDADCQWVITSTLSFVTLTFVTFSTEAGYDFVVLRDGNDTRGPLIDVLSGSPPATMGPFYTTQIYMFVLFYSDTQGTSTGFNATYMSIDMPVTVCGSILEVAPNGTEVQPGWGPMCYIDQDDISYVNVPCRDLIQNLPQNNIGDSTSLLDQGGNFGCHPITTDDFVGSETACFPNYNQGLTLSSVQGATKMMVCIFLPANATTSAK